MCMESTYKKEARPSEWLWIPQSIYGDGEATKSHAELDCIKSFP